MKTGGGSAQTLCVGSSSEVLTEQTFPIKPVEKVTTGPRPCVARH